MQFRKSIGSRRGAATLAAAGVAALAATGVLVPGTAGASSHRESPLTAANPQVDDTDTYAFVPANDPSEVAIIGNWIPFEHPSGGPNFYPFSPDAHYDMNIDNNGDAKADIVYRWTFTNHYRDPNSILYNTGVVNNLTDKTLNFYQTYTLQRIDRSGTHTVTSNAMVAPSHVGDASMPHYSTLRAQAVYKYGRNSWTFAGQADDPFFLDLRVFDLLYGGNFSEVGHQTNAGFNVNSIALQVPKSDLALNGDAAGNPVVGVWTETSRRGTIAAPTSPTHLYTGAYRQISRLGNPLVNEVVIPLAKKDLFNATDPNTDAQFLPYVTNPILPKLVNAVYGVPVPKTPRNDLVEVFLTGIYKGSAGPVQADLNSQLINKDVNAKKFVPGDELRLNMAVAPSKTPNRLGVLGGDLAGFPNGRRLADDTTDVELRVAEGVLLPGHPTAVEGLTDKVDGNDVPYASTFPYVGLPHSGSSTGPRG
jgi:Domain of unknown function (DUF4331)